MSGEGEGTGEGQGEGEGQGQDYLLTSPGLEQQHCCQCYCHGATALLSMEQQHCCQWAGATALLSMLVSWGTSVAIIVIAVIVSIVVDLSGL